MAPSGKVRTAKACEIADVDHQRFNETIAKGFYPCVPPTARGSTRLFDLDDIVALTVYGDFLKHGTIPRVAGPVACGLRELLREHPDLALAYYFRDKDGGGEWRNTESGFIGPEYFRTEKLDVSMIRKQVSERLSDLERASQELDD